MSGPQDPPRTNQIKRTMNKLIITALFATVLAGPALAQKEKMVGGAAMYPTKNIIENAVNSKDHTTLVAAVKAADLVETLSGAGPFTVFAPDQRSLRGTARWHGGRPIEA
jgi:uncharacterized surface protein with fasciclin (FAS1) repeats